jgi:uncharacterized protein (TIGR02466 family)
MNQNFWDYSVEQNKTELKSIHHTFPTPIFESDITVSNTDEIIGDLLEKYSKAPDYQVTKSVGDHLLPGDDERKLERNKVSFYTEDTLHETPIYSELKNSILEIASSVFNAYAYIDIEPHMETMWGNVLGHSGYIHPHSHSNCMFAGVWYPQDPPHVAENSLSNYIRFIDPTRMKYFYMPKVEGRNELNSGEIYMKPRKGMCLIFPSWLEHDTVPNENTEETRFSISFNLFFRGSLGFPNSLNRLTVL